MYTRTVGSSNFCCARSVVPSTAEEVRVAQTICQPPLVQFVRAPSIPRFTLALGCHPKSPARVSPAVLAFLCPRKEIINLLLSSELPWCYLEGLNMPQLEQSPSAKTGRGLLVNIVLLLGKPLAVSVHLVVCTVIFLAFIVTLASPL